MNEFSKKSMPMPGPTRDLPGVMMEVKVQALNDGNVNVNHPPDTSPQAIAIYIDVLATAIKILIAQRLLAGKQPEQPKIIIPTAIPSKFLREAK